MASPSETIRKLSPQALTMFKKQAYEKARSGDVNYSRIISDPEMADIFSDYNQSQGAPQTQVQAPQQPTSLPQKALNTFMAPFNWIGENITEPFGAIVTSPFTKETTPRQAGESWLQSERKQYEEQVPGWVKFGVETIPWLVPSLFSGGAGMVGRAGQALSGIGKISKIAKGGELIGKAGQIAKVGDVLRKGSGLAGVIEGMGKAGTTAGKISRAAGGLAQISPWGLTEQATGAVLGAAGRALKGGIRGIAQPLVQRGAVPGVIDSAIQQSGMAVLPTEELLNQAYKQDALRGFAQWAETKPLLGKVVKAVLGESGFINAQSVNPTEVVRRSFVNMLRLEEIGSNINRYTMPRLSKFGNIKQLVNMADDGLVNNAIPLKSGGSKYIGDILDNIGNYKFTDKATENFFKEVNAIKNELNQLRIAEGIKPKDLISRPVKAIQTQDGRIVESKFGSDPSLHRLYETQEEAVLAHLGKGERIIYNTDPMEIMSSEIDRTIRSIARKRFVDNVKPLGKTAIERFATTYPEKATQIEALTSRVTSANSALRAVQNVITTKGSSIAGATMAKIRRDLPDIAIGLERLYEIKPREANAIITSITKTLRGTTGKINKEYADVLAEKLRAQIRGTNKFNITELRSIMQDMKIEENTINKIMEKSYKETYALNKQAFADFLKNNKDNINKLINNTKTQLKPLKKDRYEYLSRYAGREALPHKLGEGTERIYNKLPEFRDKFFPDDVVTFMEKNYAQKGNEWVAAMGTLGGVSRSLTAVLDDSAPFIQGLAVFGRRPDVWAKTVKGQFEFLVKPQNLAKHMALPEIQVLNKEMARYSVPIAVTEMFEALPVVKKIAGKIPLAGGVAKEVVKQTYGRAEALYTGFLQLARENLWKSLRKPNMSEAALQELGRTVSLMTGDISTKAMGISATQRSMESAFVAFAPRFTRASLALIGDAFRGGLAGAEARKSIAGLMASGTAMYIGVSAALGQEPNLNPTSAKFMTVEIGDTKIGIGGMLYSLARLGGNLATVDNPTDLLKLDRFDNPFIKFMYGKTSPLTGTIVGLIERTDYMGEPFETPADWAGFLASKFIPFTAQPLLDKDTTEPQEFVAQFMGGRAFPESAYDVREELRDKVALEEYSAKYKSLPRSQRILVDKNSQIQEMSQKIRDVGRETTESITWDNWNVLGENIEDGYRQEIEMASAEYRDTGNGSQFKDRIDATKNNRRYAYALRAKLPEFETIQTYFNTPKTPTQLAEMNPLDLASDAYYKAMYSPEMYDQYDRYNFEEADKRETMFVQQYGQEALNEIENASLAKWEGTSELRQLQEARKILEPYFELENQMWRQYPPELKSMSDQIKIIENTDPRRAKMMLAKSPQIVMIRTMIASQKQRMKATNPQIKSAINMFYAY